MKGEAGGALSMCVDLNENAPILMLMLDLQFVGLFENN